MRWLIVLLVVLAVGLAGWGWFKWRTRTHSINLLVTVSIDTPEGVRTGQSVVQTWRKWQMPLWGASNYRYLARGDAVAVDLGQRGVVFVLFPASTDYVSLLDVTVQKSGAAVGITMTGGDDRAVSAWPALKRRKTVLTVASDDVPTLVRFENLNDPASVQGLASDDLAATLGPGYSFRGMTLQATEAPVSRTLDRWLPWVDRTTLAYGMARKAEGRAIERVFPANHTYLGGGFRRDPY